MSRYDDLLDELCVGQGWCGSKQDGKFLHVDDFIPDEGTVSADQFAEWVILADSEDPNSEVCKERRWKEKIIEIFKKCMGADEVDCTLLK